mmetsp:Transcript_10189/g.44332  ORF Transcript_10189/g.44332 Transcript_10189/m.44332 type:complete len:321 (-) Transcript_10189:314-1276(-)
MWRRRLERRPVVDVKHPGLTRIAAERRVVLDLDDEALPTPRDARVGNRRKPNDRVGRRADGRHRHRAQTPLVSPPIHVHATQTHLLAHALRMVKHQRGDRAGLLRAAPRHPHAALAPPRRHLASHRPRRRPRRGVADERGRVTLRRGALRPFLRPSLLLRLRLPRLSVAGGPRGEILRFPDRVVVVVVGPSVDGRDGSQRVQPRVIRPRPLRVRCLLLLAAHPRRRRRRPQPQPAVRAEQGSVVAAPATPHAERLAHAVLPEPQRGGEAPRGDPARVKVVPQLRVLPHVPVRRLVPDDDVLDRGQRDEPGMAPELLVVRG